jgi:hypothetical protein
MGAPYRGLPVAGIIVLVVVGAQVAGGRKPRAPLCQWGALRVLLSCEDTVSQEPVEEGLLVRLLRREPRLKRGLASRELAARHLLRVHAYFTNAKQGSHDRSFL